ncbi:MAG: F0F1 ATP synthase subunit B [Alcaligenaceae bacterium]|nr:F0F1 ATP synthase subunit B [Alcaligenaceae bacterium]
MNLNATLIFQTLVFVLLGIITMKFIWPPLVKAIDERREKIAEGLAAAEKGKAELVLTKAQIGEEVAKAKAAAQTRLQEIDRQAAVILEEARAKAEADSAAIVKQAQADIELELQSARDRLREDVAVLAVQGAEQILKREVDAQAHAQLLEQLKSSL